MRAIRSLRHVIRGCGFVPGYGNHPGTATLGLFVAMGGGVGASRGDLGIALGGALLMLVVFGPMYLYGAYDRSRSAERAAPEPTSDERGET